MNDNQFCSTSFHDDIIIATYEELVRRLGEPQIDGSGDGKTQKEWQFTTDDNVFFTIYDWKEYYRDVTDGGTIEWHIGHAGGDKNRNSIRKWLEAKDVEIEKMRSLF